MKSQLGLKDTNDQVYKQISLINADIIFRILHVENKLNYFWSQDKEYTTIKILNHTFRYNLYTSMKR